MAKITVPNGPSINAPDNRRLVLALIDANIDILHRCGGNARCTTCRVRFHAGEPDTMTRAEYERLQAKNLLGQMRLSCQILCDHDMTVEPLQTLTSSGLDDAGPQPQENITPEPEWIAPARR